MSPPAGGRNRPTRIADDEDARQLHRTRESVQQDRNRLINRLKTLIISLANRPGDGA